MTQPIRPEIGLVDGSVPASTRRFHVVLHEHAVAQLDDLVVCTQALPGGGEVTHYGIVVEGTGQIEGAELPTDTQRIAAERTMPGVTVRRVEVQVLRTVPELWLPPLPGAAVRRVSPGPEREAALFIDQMVNPLPIGVDQSGEPVLADFSFINGEKGGHVSISGVSGVATKTSYALFLLYMLFETEEGRRLLGPHGPGTHALVFNVKGEDLLHIDRPNSKFDERDRTRGRIQSAASDSETPAAGGSARAEWRALGVSEPGGFNSVALYAPRAAGSREGAVATDVTSRSSKDVIAFGWPPRDFIREGLLKYCFVEDEDSRTQVPFIEQRVRLQLMRWAYPLEYEPGAVVLCDPPDTTSQVPSRILAEVRDPRPAGAGHPVRTFDDLLELLDRKISPDTPTYDPRWTANAAAGTCQAFLRRLYAQSTRLGHLITTGVEPVRLAKSVTVVDIHSLHDAAQRFVVGALLSRIFEEKQGKGREPLRFIVLDELNKYAPRQGTSPIKEVLVDIAARGRSLGVLLIGAQQSAADVDGNITRNAALKIVGRLDAGEASDYKFLSSELRERAARFLPGTMVVDQPLIPAPLPLRFPFPAFATCVAEGEPPRAARKAAGKKAFEGL
ncbi:MAG: ATP-binding protein [Polyangiaceae bacterium]